METGLNHSTQMVVIRAFETESQREYKLAQIGGYCHLSTGQEARRSDHAARAIHHLRPWEVQDHQLLAVIISPQAAILAVGAIAGPLTIRDGELAPRESWGTPLACAPDPLRRRWRRVPRARARSAEEPQGPPCE